MIAAESKLPDAAVPAPLAEHIAAIDREIAEHRADIEHCEKRAGINLVAIERCEAIKKAYLHAARILVPSQPTAPIAPQAAAARRRRDLRAEVRECLAVAPDGLLPAEIGTRLQIRPAQVDSALKWLRGRGELAPVAYDGKIKLAKEEAVGGPLFEGGAND